MDETVIGNYGSQLQFKEIEMNNTMTMDRKEIKSAIKKAKKVYITFLTNDCDYDVEVTKKAANELLNQTVENHDSILCIINGNSVFLGNVS